MPDCHGAVYLRSGSNTGLRSPSIMFACTFGVLRLSIGSRYPSRTQRAAIQSVSATRSRPVGRPAASSWRTFPKNSLLSLMSST